MPPDHLDFEIIGEEMQALVVTLDPNEAVVAEAGTMLSLEDGIDMATSLSMNNENTGLLGKLMEAGKRAIAGDSFFVTIFTNKAPTPRDACFAAPYPGRIVPIDLSLHRGQLLCQRDSFLCAARGVKVEIAFTKRIGAGLFGGEGFILQRLSSDTGRGQAFLHAGGMVLEHSLDPGETLRVDTGCVVAFDTTVKYDIQMVAGLKNKLFGGEGLFFTTLTGPGKVWIQTLPFSRLADRVIAASGVGSSD